MNECTRCQSTDVVAPFSDLHFQVEDIGTFKVKLSRDHEICEDCLFVLKEQLRKKMEQWARPMRP